MPSMQMFTRLREFNCSGEVGMVECIDKSRSPLVQESISWRKCMRLPGDSRGNFPKQRDKGVRRNTTFTAYRAGIDAAQFVCSRGIVDSVPSTISILTVSIHAAGSATRGRAASVKR